MTNHTRRRKLPHGLHWDSRSPYIFFKWRDAMGRHSGTLGGGERPAILDKTMMGRWTVSCIWKPPSSASASSSNPWGQPNQINSLSSLTRYAAG